MPVYVPVMRDICSAVKGIHRFQNLRLIWIVKGLLQFFKGISSMLYRTLKAVY
jgi:hypothetical protein